MLAGYAADINGMISVPGGTSAVTKITRTYNVAARTFAPGDKLSLYIDGPSSNSDCNFKGTTRHWYAYGNSANGPIQTEVELPMGGGSTLAKPGNPGTPTAAPSGDGGTTLTWTAPTSGEPVDFYRIYRDGQNYTQRVDTVGANTLTWTDTDTGGTSHSYRVTAVSANLAESDQTAAASG